MNYFSNNQDALVKPSRRMTNFDIMSLVQKPLHAWLFCPIAHQRQNRLNAMVCDEAPQRPWFFKTVWDELQPANDWKNKTVWDRLHITKKFKSSVM
jgi:hypothetical protein